MTSPNDHPAGEPLHRLEQQRRENRAAAAALGLDPYGQRTEGIIDLAWANLAYDPRADELHKQALPRAREEGYQDPRPIVKVAGRIMLHRDTGKLVWMNLRDHSADLQIAISQRDCDEQSFQLAKLTDMGDVVIAEGPLLRTRTGEITVWASSLRPAAKCLIPPPEKHAGLHDIELRYRQRYIDLWATPQALRIFKLRSALVARLRRFLDERGYLEVETPMLQALPGGAAARPFITHMNALDLNLYLRIAPELYLKRLLVGGLPRVYEVNRNFRNEGLDKQHNPEFTMLELYEAYGDYHTMMEITESLIRELAMLVVMEQQDRRAEPAPADELPTELVLPFGDLLIDYSAPFRRMSYAELFHQALGFDMQDTRRIQHAILERHLLRKIKGAAPPPQAPWALPAERVQTSPAQPTQAEALQLLQGIAPVLLINTLFEEVAEASLDPARPTFITEYPAAISPLTRPNRQRPQFADRADLFIGHMELAPMYTELNDPDIQEAKFREQLAGVDEEERTFRTFDDDFIRALKVGMPPAGGMGLGIDRLTMLLTNQRTIRDVILFPLMRPQ
jgi:lysyl-tRNA synthetase, class II